MTLAKLVAKKDEKLQEFRNRLDDLEDVRAGLYDLLDSYDAKFSTLTNCAYLYPHLHDDLETTKKLLKESYVQQEPLIRSIETLQHLLRKYMGY